MKCYSTLRPLVMSFYSPRIYRDIAFSWRGACVLYLLILTALTQIPSAVIFHRQTKVFVREEAPPIVAQVPRMEFKDGTLATEEHRAYQIKAPGSGEILAIIDTTGATKSLDGTPAHLLFTPTQVFVRENLDETRIRTYPKEFDFTITRQRLTRLLELVERYAAAVIYLTALFFVTVWRLLQALVLSLAGLLFAKTMHVPITYGAVYRLTAAAMTPAIVVGTLCGALGLAVPFPGLVFLALALGYLVFAVKTCAGAATA